MILFGLAEVVTGFTHRFFGISTAQGSIVTYLAAAIGGLYIVSGLLILTMKRWAAAVAIVLLSADIAGRVLMAKTGLYPLNTVEQSLAIIIGTAIAAVFAIYIMFQWRNFR